MGEMSEKQRGHPELRLSAILILLAILAFGTCTYGVLRLEGIVATLEEDH